MLFSRTPTPGYYNEDPIPDFLVKYQTGPGFPIYYHAQVSLVSPFNSNSPFFLIALISNLSQDAELLCQILE